MSDITPADEAGETAVSSSPPVPEAGVGAAVPIHVTVEDVGDDGIGSHETTVTVGDGAAASITDVEVLGDPGETSVTIAEDGQSADLMAALMDTATNESVDIARVYLTLEETGTASLEVEVDVLTDETGDFYTVTEASGTTVDAIDELKVEITEEVTVEPDTTAEFEVTGILLDHFMLTKLWTDWPVSVEAVDDDYIPETPPDTLEIDWPEVQPLTLYTVEVDLPDRYVGGTYLLDMLVEDSTEDDAEQVQLTLEIDPEK